MKLFLKVIVAPNDLLTTLDGYRERRSPLTPLERIPSINPLLACPRVLLKLSLKRPQADRAGGKRDTPRKTFKPHGPQADGPWPSKVWRRAPVRVRAGKPAGPGFESRRPHHSTFFCLCVPPLRAYVAKPISNPLKESMKRSSSASSSFVNRGISPLCWSPFVAFREFKWVGAFLSCSAS